MILASSPSPSRRTTVPVPYLGWFTVIPVRALLRGAGGAVGNCRVGPCGRGNWDAADGGSPEGAPGRAGGAPDKGRAGPCGRENREAAEGGPEGALGRTGDAGGRLNVMPRSPKNCEMLSSEL